MRVLLTTVAIVLAAFAFSPVTGLAKGPGKGGGGFGVTLGGGGPGVYWGSGSPSYHSPSWYSGYGHRGYPGYGYGWGTSYGYPVQPYVVQRPILENTLPVPVFSGGPIKIVNPATNTGRLNYTLNGMPYSIEPGQTQEFTEDRAWVIDFDRGRSLGMARYSLQTGVYRFAMTDRGWELYNEPLPRPATGAMSPDTPPSLPPVPTR